MDLGNQRESSNVEDRRGMGMVGGGLGLGGIAVALVAYFLGFDPGTALNVAQQVTTPHQTQQGKKGAPADEGGQFSAKILGSTEDVWGAIFRQSNASYRTPTLVLYERQTGSACGTGQAAMGPFYCPGDEKLYLDLSFFRDLQARFRAPGEFARAYVIAHEVGHHIQKLTGAFQKMEAARGRVSPTEYNRISVRMELQADCYAGVWAHHAGTAIQLNTSDIAAALNAATAIGDDRLQQQAQGRVVPESFTHGSSQQRVDAVRQGLSSSSLAGCGIQR